MSKIVLSGGIFEVYLAFALGCRNLPIISFRLFRDAFLKATKKKETEERIKRPRLLIKVTVLEFP